MLFGVNAGCRCHTCRLVCVKSQLIQVLAFAWTGVQDFTLLFFWEGAAHEAKQKSDCGAITQFCVCVGTPYLPLLSSWPVFAPGRWGAVFALTSKQRLSGACLAMHRAWVRCPLRPWQTKQSRKLAAVLDAILRLLRALATCGC